MATSYLRERSLGNIKIGSGHGSPDHSAVDGSLYVNWFLPEIFQSSYPVSDIQFFKRYEVWLGGQMMRHDQSTTITVSTAGTWYTITAFPFSTAFLKGWTYSGGQLTAGAKTDGKYELLFSASFTTSDYLGSCATAVAIYKNGVLLDRSKVESNLAYNSETANHSNELIVDVSPGDYFEIVVKNKTGTENFDLLDVQLSMRKV